MAARKGAAGLADRRGLSGSVGRDRKKSTVNDHFDHRLSPVHDSPNGERVAVSYFR